MGKQEREKLRQFAEDVGINYVVAAAFAIAGYPAMAGYIFAGGVSSAGIRALTPIEEPDLGQADRGYLVNQIQPTGPAAVIYGETRVGGVIFYRETTSNNKILHVLIALAGHEVNSIGTILANDEELTIDGSGNVTAPAKYVGKLKIYKHLGADDQAADANLVAESSRWTSEHKARGIAYIYARMEYDADAFPNGVPVLTAIVQGKKVYDPTDVSQSATDSSTWTYSNNPALCMRDYLNYAGIADYDEFNDTLISAAKNICDETVTIKSGTQSRYTMNGTFTLQAKPNEVIKNITSCMAGTVWYSQGKWSMKAGAYTTPVFSGSNALSADDFRAPIEVSTKSSRRDSYNKISGIYRGSETNFFDTSYPTIASATFLAEDNNLENEVEVNLPYTDTSAMAQRIAKIMLFRNREDVSFSGSFGLRALELTIGDFVEVNYPRFGWDNKVFEVLDWRFALTDDLKLEVNMSFGEISPEVYQFDLVDEAVFITNNTSLLSPFDVPEVSVGLSQAYKIVNESISTTLVVNVSSSAAERVDYVEVEYKKSTDSDYSILGTGDLGRFEILNVDTPLAGSPAGISYDVRARAINAFGVKGSFRTILNHSIDPDELGPSAPSAFSKQLSGGTLFFSWTASTDLDLSYYKLWHSSSTTATFDDAKASPPAIIEKIARPATSVAYPALSGTFFIEPYDKSGNEGASASVVVLPSELPQLGLSNTQAEDPDFDGVSLGGSSNVAVATGPNPDELRLSSFATADSDGTYLFAGPIDGGSAAEYIFPSPSLIRTVRVSTNLTSTRHHANAVAGEVNWDDIPNNWNTWPNNWDDWSDEDQPYGDFAVAIYVAATDDDPTGSPTWGDWQAAAGEVTGRAFKFKAELQSETDNVSPSISVLEGIVEY